MQPIFLDLKIFGIRYYGLMYLTAFWVATKIGKRISSNYGIAPELVEKFGYWTIFSGIIGARIYYILFTWSAVKQDLWDLFPVIHIPTLLKGDLLNSIVGVRGLAIHGGIIGAAIGIIIFSRIYKLSFFKLVDLASPLTMLGQVFGRFGNYANGETHGVPTFTPWKVLFKGNFAEWWSAYEANPLGKYYPELVPWGVVFPPNTPAGMEFPNYALHPAMVYEMIFNLIGFIILFFHFRKKNLASGSLGALYVITYGIIRTIVSFFRAEDLMFMGYKAPYIANAGFIIFGLGLLWFLNKRKKEE